MIDPADNTLMKWLTIAARTTNGRLNERLRPFGVNASQYFYVIKIHDNPAITQDQLMAADYLNPSNVTRAITQLTGAGLVTKQRDAADKRKFVLSLTAAGDELYPQLVAVQQLTERELAEQVQQVYPTCDIAQLTAALRALS